MSTRCQVGFVDLDGSLTVSYVMCDGYLKGVGQSLLKNWNSRLQASIVANMGAQVSLGKRYTKGTLPKHQYQSIEEWAKDTDFLYVEYAYLWDDNTREWKLYHSSNKDIKDMPSLELAIKTADEPLYEIKRKVKQLAEETLAVIEKYEEKLKNER